MHMRIIAIILISLISHIGYGQSAKRMSGNLMELPKITAHDNLIIYTGFTVSYNTSTLIPNWVAYELTSTEVEGQFPRKGQFGQDLSFRGRQAMREDYSNSGWDKGHMCPAADLKWSEKTMYESFYLTNICPQNHEMNSTDWLTLEKLAREWAKKFDNIYIICGPIVGENKYGTIGKNRVVVPDAFFKAFLTVKNNVFNTIAFVMPNSSEHHRVQDYAMSVNDLETMIGIDLFSSIDDRYEEIVESDLYFKYWGL